MKELFCRVMDRMIKAGWLAGYTYTDGKGFWRNWTEIGSEAMTFLKEVESRLVKGVDEAPAILDILSQGIGLEGTADPEGKIEALFDALMMNVFARKAYFDTETGSELELTDDGRALFGLLRGLIDQLGLRGDRDGLMVMFVIARQFGTPETGVKFIE